MLPEEGIEGNPDTPRQNSQPIPAPAAYQVHTGYALHEPGQSVMSICADCSRKTELSPCAPCSACKHHGLDTFTRRYHSMKA